MIQKPTAIDSIIQGSTVELLQTYGVSAAPRRPVLVQGYVPVSELVAHIDFEGSNIGGALVLAVPESIYNMAAATRPKSTTYADWSRELTNQLMGRIKNRLIQFQVKLKTHVPTVVSNAAFARQSRRRISEVLYTFGALRGDVQLTVDASLTRVPLQYSNASLLLEDADGTLFE